MNRQILPPFLLLFSLFIVACGTLQISVEDTPTPKATAAPEATGTMPPATHTPVASIPTPILPQVTVVPPTVPSTVACPTATPTFAPPTHTPAAAPGTPSPAETHLEPQIFSFKVIPTKVDPGDTVTLTWEASGDRAIICPSARFVLFTDQDCRQVSLTGATTFTVTAEAKGFQFINYLLQVEAQGVPTPAMSQVSVAIKCHTTWFFSNEPQAGICPREPLRSYAAAQRFERGTMIWLEQPGRYIILSKAGVDGPGEKTQFYYVNDPLEIIRDTSADIDPPEDLYAPVSGFGLVWRGDVSHSPGYRETLGWALAPEFGCEAILQCDDALPSGGRSWQTCYLKGPDEEIIVLHPLGRWYLLDE